MNVLSGYRARKNVFCCLIFKHDRLKYKKLFFFFVRSSETYPRTNRGQQFTLFALEDLYKAKESVSHHSQLVLLELRTDHDIFHCLKSINGLSNSVVTQHSIMTVSFIYGHRSQKPGSTFINSLSMIRVNYSAIYALLFSLILFVSLKKNKVLYCEKFK